MTAPLRSAAFLSQVQRRGTGEGGQREKALFDFPRSWWRQRAAEGRGGARKNSIPRSFEGRGSAGAEEGRGHAPRGEGVSSRTALPKKNNFPFSGGRRFAAANEGRPRDEAGPSSAEG